MLSLHRRLSNLLLLSSLLIAAPAGAVSFTGLPFMEAWDVSANGRTVVGGGGAPVTWTAAGGPTVLPLPVGTGSGAARAVSVDGSIAVGVANGPEQAVRWVPSLEVLSSSPSLTLGVNADGTIAVGQANSVPVRWDAGVGPSALPGASLGLALGITAEGTRIVGQALIPGGGFEAVEWTGGSMIELENLGGGSAARAISADGSAIVGRVAPFGSGANHLAARWVDSVLSTLGTIPGTFHSDAWDVSADGSVVVGFSGVTLFQDKHAMIWDEAHGMRDLAQVLENQFGLDLTGWTLEIAT